MRIEEEPPPVIRVGKEEMVRDGGKGNTDELLPEEPIDGLRDEQEEPVRDAMRLANQSGSLGAVLGFGGMTFGDPEDVVETPGGSFTLGKEDT